jgi:hypothetical protein
MGGAEAIEVLVGSADETAQVVRRSRKPPLVDGAVLEEFDRDTSARSEEQGDSK